MAGDRLEPARVSAVGMTPDEAQMLRRRQEWRERVLVLCIQYLEAKAAPAAARVSSSPGQQGGLERFLELAEDIKRDLHRVLQSELGVPELDAHRHAANYFLDHLILFVRRRSEERNRTEGHPPSPPLEGLSQQRLEEEVALALEGSAPALWVFVNDLVSLEEFELEVRRQRQRLQFLLGCDRSLRDLAESNAEIIEAGPEEMAEIVREFFRICSLLQDELPPLLVSGSPFPRLAAELEAARDQLAKLLREAVDPLQEVRAEVEAFERELLPAVESLRDLAARVEGVMRTLQRGSWERLSDDGDLPRQADRLHAELLALLERSRSVAEVTIPRTLERMGQRERRDLAPTMSVAARELGAARAELHKLIAEELSPAAGALKGAGPAQLQAPEEVSALLGALRSRLRELLPGPLRAASRAVDELAAANVLLLKERICQELGSIRATFLQPRFAHIAANDPRSTQSPQYFYFKEFADEATRSQELLRSIHTLWRFIEDLQETHIEGLRFTPRNLNRIAQRVLLERRTVPGGHGWRELAGFLEAVKDRLVPRLQLACSLAGIRFDDRNQLAAFADQLTRSCGELLAQRETASRLVRELEALARGAGVDSELHRRYQEAVLRVTCEEMAQKLRQISRALMELVPYVGAMIGGIRMRTSLAFATDRGMLPP